MWHGTVQLEPGRLLFSGRLGAAHRHHHAAVQVVLAIGDALTLSDAAGQELICHRAVIPPGAEHEMAGHAEGSIAFIDPTGHVGRDLVARVSATNLPSGSVAAWVAAGEHLVPEEVPRDFSWLTTDRCGDAVVPLHPSLLRATQLIPQMLTGPVRITEVASIVGISGSRLGHLFAAELGLPFSAFVRWARLQVAMDHARAGSSLTEAAHAAGFSDSSHLTRVCHAMFGLAPSHLAGAVAWS